jgi:hypothetical protein
MFDLSPQLDCAGRILTLDRPRIVGIVNVTPDSFSDGGEHATLDAAIAHGLRLAEKVPMRWISAASPRVRVQWTFRRRKSCDASSRSSSDWHGRHRCRSASTPPSPK